MLTKTKLLANKTDPALKYLQKHKTLNLKQVTTLMAHLIAQASWYRVHNCFITHDYKTHDFFKTQNVLIDVLYILRKQAVLYTRQKYFLQVKTLRSMIVLTN